MVFDTPMILNMALYLYFEGAKNIYVLSSPDMGFGECWGFGGGWMILTWVWHLELDLDMVTGL